MDKVITVAEAGINHNGNIEIAKQLINVAKVAGVDYVKFQKRDIDSVYSIEELSNTRESPWGITTRKQKQGLEFGYEEYCEIDRYCDEVKMKWFASPWDLNSIDFLLQFYPDFIKVPSALITYQIYLDRLKETQVPLIVSTGMSTYAEIYNVVNFFGSQIVYLLHCTSSYPCKEEEINLSFILELIKQFPSHNIGYSNHSTGIISIPIAVALGAKMVEFHITLDRAMYGSDQPASIEPQGVFRICKYIDAVHESWGDGKKHVYDSEIPIIKKLRKY